MKVIRAFIAVEIENPEVLRKLIRVRDAIAGVGGVKPVEDENIHLTIRFLGEVSEGTISEMKRILAGLSSVESFVMRVRGVGAFPSPSRPRVVWAGVAEGADKLRMIRSFVDRAIVEHRLRDVKPDQHGFSPHITLARVKNPRAAAKLSQLLLQLQDEDFGTTPVTSIKLKRSILTPRGPIYHDIYEVELSRGG